MHARIHTRLCTILSLFFLAAASAFAQPKIHIVGGDTLDWGYAPPGVLSRGITVVNQGDQNLELKGLASSQASVVGDISNPVIAPGDSLQMTIQMETLRTVGQKSAWVKIESNDPTRRFLNLALRAYAMRPMFVEPDGAILFKGTQVVGEEASIEVSMVNMSPTAFTLSPNAEIQGCDAVMRVEIPPSLTIPAGGKATFKVYLVPLEAGNKECFIEFRSQNDEFPPAKVQVYFSGKSK